MGSTADLVMLRKEAFFPEGEEALPKVQISRENAGKQKRKFNGKKFVKFAAAAFIVGGLSVAGYSYMQWASQFESTDNAYVTGDVHPVSPRIAGTVAAVLVDDNQHVKKGDLLVQLDDRDAKTALAQAQAKLDEAHAQAVSVEAEIAQAEAKINETAAQVQKATADYSRASALEKSRVIARAEYDTTRAAFQTAQAANAGAKSALAAVQARLALANAQVQTAKSALDAAKLQLSYTQVLAPADGKIGKKTAEAGQQAQPGEPLLAVVEDHPWVTANFKETQLVQMHPGERVDVEVDAVPHKKFEGTINSLAPGSGAQFALLPPDNATGNFTKIVQRVPVKVTLASESLRGFEDRIVPGLSAVVTVHVGSK